jgi:trigger factor
MLSTGAPLSIDITFPEEFAVPDLVGRTATYSVSPKAIRERVLPELDDEFVKQFELDSVDAFKARMRENMEEQAQQNEKGRQREEVSKWLIEKTSLELPQSVLEEETRMTARSIVDNVVRSGATQEQIAEQQQVILDTATQTSTNRVKLNYILTRIAEEESLSVTDEEFEKNLAEMAARYNMPPAELLKRINENNGMDRMRSDILSEKTLDHLLDIAKIK